LWWKNDYYGTFKHMVSKLFPVDVPWKSTQWATSVLFNELM
jgi:hypothetical protein